MNSRYVELLYCHSYLIIQAVAGRSVAFRASISVKCLAVGTGGSAWPFWTVIVIRWLAIVDGPRLELGTESEDGTWRVWKSYKKRTIEIIVHRNKTKLPDGREQVKGKGS